jgi:hypothetical protein
MAGMPKVKVTFDADLDGLKKGVKSATADVDGFGDTVAKYGKAAAVAFAAAAAAAGAYAIKIGVEGVKAAIEDEKSQNQLRIALERATGATEDQIRATEGQISKMSLAYGIADDKLRPAMSRLSLATSDQSKAQDLLSVAMDVSAATGKPLESVSNALAKAYEGNTGALGKLGVGLNKAELASMSMNDITTTLSKTFAGAATEAAGTFDGRMKRIKVGIDEAKESIGAALLPTVGRLIDYINRQVVPAFNAFALGLNNPSGDASLTEGFTDTQLAAYNFGITVRDLGGQMQKLFNVFNNDANTGNTSGLSRLIGWMNTIVNAVAKVVEVAGYGLALLSTLFEDPFASFEDIQLSIQKKTGVISGRNKAKMGEQVGYVGSMMVGGGYTPSAAAAAPSGVGVFGTGGTSGGGTSGGGGLPSFSTSAVPSMPGDLNFSYRELEAMGLTGFELSAEQMARNISATQIRPTSVVNNNISIGVATDAEQTARSIIGLLNSSQGRGTLGAQALVAR